MRDASSSGQALADRPRVAEVLALADFVNSSTREEPNFHRP